MPEPHLRRHFRFVALDGASQVCTGIAVEVPAGLTRQEAVDFVTGRVAAEVARYAASEALGFGPHDQNTDWKEKVT